MHVRDTRNTCEIVVGKLQGKRPLNTHRHGEEDSIQIEFREIGREDVNWIQLVQASAEVGHCTELWVP
jgi:hypothetical protein